MQPGLTWIIRNPCQKQTLLITKKRVVPETTRVKLMPVKTVTFVIFFRIGQRKEADQEVLISLVLLPRKRLKLKNKSDHFRE